MKSMSQGLPGSMMVKTSHSSARGEDLIPGLGAKFTQVLWPEKPKHKTEAIL